MTSERKSWAEIPKMWITYDDTGWIEYVHPQKIPNTVGWVRADLVDELIEALEHIEDYWNRDHNEQAMADALWHIIDTAQAALAKARGEL